MDIQDIKRIDRELYLSSNSIIKGKKGKKFKELRDRIDRLLNKLVLLAPSLRRSEDYAWASNCYTYWLLFLRKFFSDYLKYEFPIPSQRGEPFCEGHEINIEQKDPRQEKFSITNDQAIYEVVNRLYNELNRNQEQEFGQIKQVLADIKIVFRKQSIETRNIKKEIVDMLAGHLLSLKYRSEGEYEQKKETIRYQQGGIN